MSGVDDKVELHLIDTRQLVEEARKIREAKKLAQDATKAKKDLAAGIGPLGAAPSQPTGAPIGAAKNKPKSFFDSEQQSRKSAVGGARTQNAFTQQQNAIADLQRKLEAQAKRQAEIDKEQADLKKEIDQAKKDAAKKQEELEKNLVGTLKSAPALITNSSAIPSYVIAALSRFGVIGTTVAAVLAFAIGPLIEDIQKQFDRGGIFSTKLKVPRQALTLNDIDVSNSWRDGTKYITSDLRIVQKAPQSSNTLKISHEAIRYVLDDLGRGK